MGISNAWLLLFAVTPWLVVLCRYDWRERRLPNFLTLGGAACALVWRFGWSGLPFFLDGLFAALLCGAFLLIPFMLRAAGAGDVKMLFAVGSVAGLHSVPNLLVLVSIAGVIVAIFMQLNGLVDSSRLRHYVRCVFDWRYDRVAGRADLPPRDSERARIPFGVAIALGLWTLLLIQAIF